jgi:hypothetical protein
LPFTTNKLLSVPTAGTLSGVWGAGDPESLNTGVMGKLDKILGGVHSEALSASNETLSASEAENLVIRCTGVLLANVTITTPGIGFYIVDNQTTGSFTVTLQYTGGVGGTPVMPQGGVTLVAIDATNGVRIVLPGDLLAIEALTATSGILKKTSTNTWSLNTGVSDLAATTANRLYGTDASGNSGLITTGAALTQSAGSINVVAATQSNMEAQDSTNPTYPNVQKFHPGHPKAFCRADSAGTIVGLNFGVTSVTKAGTGTYTVVLTTAMSSTNYGVLATAQGDGGALSPVAQYAITNTTTFTIYTVRYGSSGGVAVDAGFTFAVMGDV